MMGDFDLYLNAYSLVGVYLLIYISFLDNLSDCYYELSPKLPTLPVDVNFNLDVVVLPKFIFPVAVFSYLETLLVNGEVDR